MYRLHCFIAFCARSGSISLDMCICRRMVAQGRQKHHPNWYTMIKTVRIFTGRPLAYPCASILRPRRCVCLPPASVARPTSSAICVRLLWTCSKLHRRWPWRGLNVLCATLDRPRHPFGLLCSFNGDLVSFVVTQRRHKRHSPYVKGVLLNGLVVARLSPDAVLWRSATLFPVPGRELPSEAAGCPAGPIAGPSRWSWRWFLINYNVKQLDPGVECSLYMDGFVIVYKSQIVDVVHRKVQHTMAIYPEELPM